MTWRELLDRLAMEEVIGQAECPMMVRWTLVKLPLGLGKLMIHYFPPETTDRDPHDHPSSFLTLILKGGYFNTEWVKVDLPEQEYMEELEWIGRGRLIFRRASHMHVTETGERSAWTLIFMGPKQRKWGFLRIEDGKWWGFEKYIERFGGVIRCDPGQPQSGSNRDYRDYKGTHPSV